MRTLNRHDVLGYVGQDPVIQTYEEFTVARFKLATHERLRDKTTGEPMYHTEWHSIVCYHQQAELVKRHVKKGDRLFVSGAPRTKRWVNEANQPVIQKEVIARHIALIETQDNPTQEEDDDLMASAELDALKDSASTHAGNDDGYLQ